MIRETYGIPDYRIHNTHQYILLQTQQDASQNISNNYHHEVKESNVKCNIHLKFIKKIILHHALHKDSPIIQYR